MAGACRRSGTRSVAGPKANGHRIVSRNADEGVSGSNSIDAREGLFDAIEAIKSGLAEAVVFTSLDRLARKMTEQEGILGEIWSAGGVAFSLGDGGVVLEDDPDDPMRTAVRQMRGVFAQLERGLIRQRMRKGKAAKAAEGGYIGGAPPFGFRGGGGDLVHDRVEMATAERIEELHRAGAESALNHRRVGGRTSPREAPVVAPYERCSDNQAVGDSHLSRR